MAGGGGVVTVAGLRRKPFRHHTAHHGPRLSAITVLVQIGIKRQGLTLVDATITVIVEPITALRSAPVDGRIVIVAVIPQADPPFRTRAGQGATILIPMAIQVDVGIPEHHLGRVVVDLAVTVVVQPIAGLYRPGMHGAVLIIAVQQPGSQRYKSFRLHTGQLNRIAIAVTITVLIGIPGLNPFGQTVGIFIVETAITVIVQTVAGFFCPRVEGRCRVVTVAGIADRAGRRNAGLNPARRVPVTIPIFIPIPAGAAFRGGIQVCVIAQAITVVVATVTDLDGPRVNGGVPIVTVAAHGIAVSVLVRLQMKGASGHGTTQEQREDCLPDQH